jgi:hypothetical protein
MELFNQTPYAHAKLVDNLLQRNHSFTPETISSGKSWYGSGQEDANYLGEKMGRDTLAGGAVIGKLSARTGWNANRMMGLQLLRVSDKQEGMVRRGAELVKEVGPEAAEGLKRRIGFKGTPLGGQSLENIDAALKVRSGEAKDPLSIFTIKNNGSSNKTSDFAVQLAEGGKHPNQVIDTHAYDAALDDYNIKYGTANKHLTKSGTYSFMQSVYNTAHAKALKAGLVPSDTTPAEYQAMHWVHQITNKPSFNASASRSAKAEITKTGNLLTNNPQDNPASHGLPPIVFRDPRSIAFNEGAGR